MRHRLRKPYLHLLVAISSGLVGALGCSRADDSTVPTSATSASRPAPSGTTKPVRPATVGALVQCPLGHSAIREIPIVHGGSPEIRRRVDALDAWPGGVGEWASTKTVCSVCRYAYEPKGDNWVRGANAPRDLRAPLSTLIAQFPIPTGAEATYTQALAVGPRVAFEQLHVWGDEPVAVADQRARTYLQSRGLNVQTDGARHGSGNQWYYEFGAASADGSTVLVRVLHAGDVGMTGTTLELWMP